MSKTLLDLSDEITYYLDFTLNMFLTPTLAALGIMGNVFNIIILYRHGYNDVTNILLAALAITDLTYSSFSVFIQSVYIADVTGVIDEDVHYYIDPFLNFLVIPSHSSIILISSLYTCIIALIRAIAVSLPLSVSKIVTTFRVKVIIALVPMFVFKSWYIYILPISSNPNSTQFWCNCDQYGDTSQQNYCVSINYIDYYISQALGFVCLVVIVIQLFRRRGRLKEMTKKSKISRSEIKTTKMLCVIFVVEIILSQDLLFYYVVQNSYSITANVNYIYYSACFCYYQFYSTINFFIYVAMSSKFSKTLKQLLTSQK